MDYKVAILIPSTSKQRPWKTFKDTYFYNIFLKSFLTTYDKQYKYTIFLVVDDDDIVYSNPTEKKELLRFIDIMQNVDIQFISSNGIQPGYVTHMWNKAFKTAYDLGFDYFFQCGDDIKFLQPNWVKQSIYALRINNNIGLTGPIDHVRWCSGNHSRPGGSRFIQTQSFVSRKHMEFFGFYFPPEIKNWYCDDWMTHVYYPGHFYFIRCFAINAGGTPRYNVVGSLDNNCPIKKKCFELVSKHRSKIITL